MPVQNIQRKHILPSRHWQVCTVNDDALACWAALVGHGSSSWIVSETGRWRKEGNGGMKEYEGREMKEDEGMKEAGGSWRKEGR